MKIKYDVFGAYWATICIIAILLDEIGFTVLDGNFMLGATLILLVASIFVEMPTSK